MGKVLPNLPRAAPWPTNRFGWECGVVYWLMGGGYPPAGYRGICETMGLSPIPSISYDVSRTCLREISETSSSLSHQILVRHMMIHFIYIIIKELSECLTKTLKPGRGVSPPPKGATHLRRTAG